MARKRKPSSKPVPIQSAARRTATYRRWLRWWKVLFLGLKTIAHHRHVYREVTAMIDANPALHASSAFYDWMRLAYVTDQASAIRRLVDRDRRSVSLIRLIEEIADHPGALAAPLRGPLPGPPARRHLRSQDMKHPPLDDTAGLLQKRGPGPK